jgi:5'-nucleotidase
MNILVTNDDGIDSPGIWSLAEAMSRLGNTLIAAPVSQQSGVGTSLSLHSGMSISEVSSRIKGVQAHAIGGTPSDCVIIGLRRLAQGHIDLLASGINLGANLGRDILYSGTVMPTLQGHFRNIPSIAFSLDIKRGQEPRFDVAAMVAMFVALSIKEGKIPAGSILNVNVPDLPKEQIKGVVATRAASSAYQRLSNKQSSGGARYSTERSKVAMEDLEEGTDIWAIAMGYVSITPIRIEVTDHNAITMLNEYVLRAEKDMFEDK